jgi:hypothetical protein
MVESHRIFWVLIVLTVIQAIHLGVCIYGLSH